MAKLVYVKMLRDIQDVPVPRDSQRLLSGEADPDQVLLIGNGPTHGWGTVTHELALTGQLARAFTRRTGRPTDIEYVGDESMTLASTIPWLGDTKMDRFDLVLLVLSMNDAVRLTPVDEYRADMERLLLKIARETKPSARVVVAGIHPVRTNPAYGGVFGALGQRNADRLNRATLEVVGRFDGFEYMDLTAPDPEPTRPYGSPQMYADWAELFTDECAPALDAARVLENDRVHAPRTERVWDWAPGKHIIDEAPKGGWDGLEDLVDDAKRTFGADIAYVTLIDGDRQYFAATTAPTGQSVPLDLTHCAVTFKGTEPVVVENSFKDLRFKGSPLIDLTQMRSYAGVPLQNADGENIGTFCVLSVLPGAKHFSEEQLREYADRAQDELQRLAEVAPQPANDESSTSGGTVSIG
jgi:GAF domain-containing protein